MIDCDSSKVYLYLCYLGCVFETGRRFGDMVEFICVYFNFYNCNRSGVQRRKGGSRRLKWAGLCRHII
jgi:hypothetical protein